MSTVRIANPIGPVSYEKSTLFRHGVLLLKNRIFSHNPIKNRSIYNVPGAHCWSGSTQNGHEWSRFTCWSIRNHHKHPIETPWLTTSGI